jgi:hypothetical protein
MKMPQGEALRVFQLNDEGEYTMPAFTFEKITPPAPDETGSPIAPVVRRGAIVRFLDRLTSARLKTSEDGIRKVQRLKHKYRKQV